MKITITGPPGSGKTTTVIRVAEMLRKKGYIVGGMVTKEIREGKVRVGFEIIDLLTGEKDVMAHVDFYDEISPYRVGKYGVKVDVIDSIGVKAIERALKEADVVIVDEVGKMELFSKKFEEAIRKCISQSEKPVIMTLHMRLRHSLLSNIRNNSEIISYTLSYLNRNVLPPLIVKELTK
ncbi:MAG TPA: NTPase [Euryarchaeota archaeon]|nr:NTPase [Euryarchaeota archaeon]